MTCIFNTKSLKSLALIIIFFANLSGLTPLSLASYLKPLSLTPLEVQASTPSSLSKIQKEITQAKQDLNQIGQAKKTLQEEIDSINGKIDNLEKQIKSTDELILKTDQEIQENIQQIDDINQEIKKNLKQLQKIKNRNRNPLLSMASSQNMSQLVNSIYSLSGINEEFEALKGEKKQQEIKLQSTKKEQLLAKQTLEEAKIVQSFNKDKSTIIFQQTQGQEDKYQQYLSEQLQKKKEMENSVVVNEVSASTSSNTSNNSPSQTSPASPAPSSTPASSGGSGFILPVVKEGTRTSRCGRGHGYPACDFASRNSPDIWASKAGTIIKTISGCGVGYRSCGGGYGNHVIIDHGNGEQTLYGHLSTVKVSVGQKVGQGEAIGVLGNTGWSTGPHLHFEIKINGFKKNPRKYIGSIPRCEDSFHNCA